MYDHAHKLYVLKFLKQIKLIIFSSSNVFHNCRNVIYKHLQQKKTIKSYEHKKLKSIAFEKIKVVKHQLRGAISELFVKKKKFIYKFNAVNFKILLCY